MICTLFTGQTGKEGIFVKYSFEFKLKCVEMYRKGQWYETPSWISTEKFRQSIRKWARLEDIFGIEALKHSSSNKKWTPNERLELVMQVLAGKSCLYVAIKNGINDGMLYQWVKKYKELGYNGLVNIKKGRPKKNPDMKKDIKPEKLNESEREELVRLRAELEYARTENAVIKKLLALRQKKEAARLKAKKQQSSKNYEKEDID